jgi:hypothetical protein
VRVALAAMLVLAVAALAIGANYALLGFATHRSDPVGKLSPVATLPSGPVTTTVPAPTTTVGEGQDD